VFFEDLRDGLERTLRELGVSSIWTSTSSWWKNPVEMDRMTAPYLGGSDPLFGTRCDLSLPEFFDREKIPDTLPPESDGIHFIYGTGASLAGLKGTLVYVDLPKNELQYRARAGVPTNLGVLHPRDPKEAYKCSYFVDWPVLNRHKQTLLPEIGILVDGQRPEPVWIDGSTFRESLEELSRCAFRARPWFEPGAWGGTWILDHIPGISPKVPNYAWSFELIAPENGLILESDGLLLECSFDWLMYHSAKQVLGDCHDRFGVEFPIRFDFLDTFGGGDLSVQVHPHDRYIRDEFGETFTQQEAYYILDTSPGAVVNLGFHENIDLEAFRMTLEQSAQEKIPVDIPKFVQSLPAHKHDLFLIPDGTVHGSGAGNLVLEISTTPYIFTFKLYDWLRKDLNGLPRDLNISRGMENLEVERKGQRVRSEFISKPLLMAEGEGWSTYHLPTHPEHLYDVMRYHVRTEITVETGNKMFVMSLVEGSSIKVITGNGREQQFHYAETFVVPAGAGSFKIVNGGTDEAWVVGAFIK
jgi:mannose-6-phosphate isomerase class I